MRSVGHLLMIETLSACLEDAAEALRAAHPFLDDIDGPLGEPPDSWLADAIINQIGALELTLRRYRAAANLHRRLLATA